MILQFVRYPSNDEASIRLLTPGIT